MRLVADIGGTNARLALCENGVIVPQTLRNYVNDDWPHLYDILAGFIDEHVKSPLNEMVVAIAGPVQADSATLTNRKWMIERSELVRQFACNQTVLLNDLTALGYAVPTLGTAQLHRIHYGDAHQHGIEQSLVVGIGTGFNVSPILQSTNAVHCLAVEAGHVSLSNDISALVAAAGCSPALFQTVEDLFSGRGFGLFCQQVTSDDTVQGAAAIQSYGDPANLAITFAIDEYARLIGQLLRGLSLAYMPSSGIYLAGSVARAVMGAAARHCAEVFKRPNNILSDRIPSLFEIDDDSAALNGCATYQV